MSDAKPAVEPKSVESPIEALAEMAAGVAHELNNPLSVISGRAQLLAESEADAERKQDLQQIQDNVSEATGVIDDLMAFAEPSKPRPAPTAIHQIIEEALELAGQKSKVDHVNAQVQAVGADGEVYVDSAQVVSALANIISNAIESYTDPSGPIKISVERSADGVMLQVRDLGCGMDADTLRKATHPFFSAKPAGRKRGMGLAYAARLIQLNRGTLALASTPHQGTTATVTLPYE
jgi:signal transduction histidine kinase